MVLGGDSFDDEVTVGMYSTFPVGLDNSGGVGFDENSGSNNWCVRSYALPVDEWGVGCDSRGGRGKCPK